MRESRQEILSSKIYSSISERVQVGDICTKCSSICRERVQGENIIPAICSSTSSEGVQVRGVIHTKCSSTSIGGVQVGYIYLPNILIKQQ
jgi:hypothetical protein